MNEAAHTCPSELLRATFGSEPSVRVLAPGRVNLIGEHVDYLGGAVMPAAIDRHLSFTAARSGRREVRVVSAWGGGVRSAIDLERLEPREGDESWLNYIIGVLAVVRRAGIPVEGFDLAIASTLPTGAGLSSSAALETGVALVVESLAGIGLDPMERAKLCQQAEREFAGVPCGIMDQVAVGLGEEGCALKIDCRDLTIETVSLPPRLALIVADTGVKHALGDGEYRARREDCEAALEILGLDSWRETSMEEVVAKCDDLGGRLFRRARHAVTEMTRVGEFASALGAGDLGRAGGLMRAGHDSLRDDFEVSCRELDALVDAAYAFGADQGLVGSRMTGGGFGGSTVTLVREAAAGDLIEHLRTAFAAEFGREIEPFVTHASAGARLL